MGMPEAVSPLNDTRVEPCEPGGANQPVMHNLLTGLERRDASHFMARGGMQGWGGSAPAPWQGRNRRPRRSAGCCGPGCCPQTPPPSWSASPLETHPPAAPPAAAQPRGGGSRRRRAPVTRRGGGLSLKAAADAALRSRRARARARRDLCELVDGHVLKPVADGGRQHKRREDVDRSRYLSRAQAG